MKKRPHNRKTNLYQVSYRRGWADKHRREEQKHFRSLSLSSRLYEPRQRARRNGDSRTQTDGLIRMWFHHRDYWGMWWISQACTQSGRTCGKVCRSIQRGMFYPSETESDRQCSAFSGISFTQTSLGYKTAAFYFVCRLFVDLNEYFLLNLNAGVGLVLSFCLLISRVASENNIV